MLKNYEELISCMSRMSEELYKLTKIIYAQQKQIHSLTGCVEQLQDLHLQLLDIKDDNSR